jgi:sialic acid synthase SpsE
MIPSLKIKGRMIGGLYPPLVIAEIGINHDGDINKAIWMVDCAYKVGCECVKFQSHIISDEMIPNEVVPANANESIWDMMERCALTEKEEIFLKEYIESKGMIFLSTPFSRAAVDRLERMDVPAYKIGSGECNNYPLIKHIAQCHKPVLLSTGMNDLVSIKPAVEILRDECVPYALLHCTSMYPTPYPKVRLGAISELRTEFPDAVIGMSDHSIGNYTCFAATALGSSILEKHFTSDKRLPGSDNPISIEPLELADLISGVQIIHESLGGKKEILLEEEPTIRFAYACVVSIKDIKGGEKLSTDNIWVKRPGTGEIKAKEYLNIIGKKVGKDILKDHQLQWSDLN